VPLLTSHNLFMKKTILHIIDNLGRGGAETMLVTVTNRLKDYNNIIVTLHPENEFGDDVKCDQLICLNLTSNFLIPSAVLKLRKIIRENKVDIVHSHLFWSTVVARMGTPKKIPLITTIHAFISSSLEYRQWRMPVIDKLTYKLRKSTIVAVAKGALDEYFTFINVKPHKAYLLYTFADTGIFKGESITAKSENPGTFRLICVGNLKEQKNHSFLLEAFKELKHENISLDIYGKGPLEPSLQKIITEQQLKVTLKGQVKDIQHRIQQYDLFVMSSSYEGFALSVLEAMALKMPLLLSDIASFKEQCADTAVYYNLKNTGDFVSKLLDLKNNRHQLNILGTAAKERVLKKFTLEQHLQRLQTIYAESLVDAHS
jgi:glycosyltransferase involved in cell wall biosynthesis